MNLNIELYFIGNIFILFFLNEVINNCNNINNTNYNVAKCWQTFDVQYTVYFKNITQLANESVTGTTLKYQRLFLNGLTPWKNGSLISALLLKTDTNEKVYLK